MSDDMVAAGFKDGECVWISILPPARPWSEFARECAKKEKRGIDIKQMPRKEAADLMRESFYKQHPELRPAPPTGAQEGQ